MLIKMLQTRRGTEGLTKDGFRIQEYLAGRTYEVRDHLGRNFIEDGAAFRCDEFGKPWKYVPQKIEFPKGGWFPVSHSVAEDLNNFCNW